MTEYNGLRTYTTLGRVNSPFFHAKPYISKKATLKSGQVLKAFTFLESDNDGKLIAHSGINEKALVTLVDMATTKTIIMAGLTFTSTAAISKALLVTAWSGLTVGMTAAQANALNPVVGGSFTAGTLTGYNTVKSSTADSVLFISTTPYAGVTDLSDTGNGTATTITVTAVNSPQKKIAGVLMYDTDASSADQEVSIYDSASFFASALKWSNDAAVDYVETADGTQVTCTDYYVGASTDNLKRKFVEASNFNELGFQHAGEVY